MQAIQKVTSADRAPMIVCLGEILIDLFPDEIGRKLAHVSAFRPKPGGAPANVAVAASRLGAPSAFIGKVGQDAFGQYLIEVMREQGVETRGMRVDPQARTTLAFIAMPDEHSAEFVFYRNPGADLQLRPDELDQALISGCRALHIGSLSLVDEPARSATYAAVRKAKEGGALVSFDVNFRPSLWKTPEQALTEIEGMLGQADMLKVNEVELKLLVGSDDLHVAPRSLLAGGPMLVVVTLGAQGSYFCTASAEGFVPAFQVRTVDSTGCGDAFVAGLLSCLVKDPGWRSSMTSENLTSYLRYASAVGALTALTQGVIPALPTASQVEIFLSKMNQS